MPKIPRSSKASRSTSTRNGKPFAMEKVKSLTMMKRYLQLIRSGQKSVEGRVGIASVRNIHPGQQLRFFNRADASDNVVCRVEKVDRYDSFQKMLESVGYKRCIPHAESMEEAVAAYMAIPNYEERQSTHGVYALHLRVINK